MVVRVWERGTVEKWDKTLVGVQTSIWDQTPSLANDFDAMRKVIMKWKIKDNSGIKENNNKELSGGSLLDTLQLPLKKKTLEVTILCSYLLIIYHTNNPYL